MGDGCPCQPRERSTGGTHHLLFRDYVQVHEFDTDELRHAHQRMADWCAVDLDTIWDDHPDVVEQARRVYARHHYITHLFLAENWPTLWQVLDSGDYGEQKTRFDPSTRLYGLDLDRGRESAINAGQSAEEHIQNLPRLWKYNLLRTSLTSRVEQWPDNLFVVLAMLRRTHEALERIELILDQKRKIQIWGRIIKWCDAQQQIIILTRMVQTIIGLTSLSDEDRFNYLITIGINHIRYKNKESGIAFIHKARSLTQSTELASDQPLPLLRLVVIYLISKNIKPAIDILESKLPLGGNFLRNIGRYRDIIASMITLLTDVGCKAKAIYFLERLTVLAQSEDEYGIDRDNIYSIIVKGYVNISEFDQAYTIAQTIGNISIYVKALTTIARGYINAKNIDHAIAILEQATAQVGSIDLPLNETTIFGNIAMLYIIVDKCDKATSVLQQGITNTTSMRFSLQRFKILTTIAKVYAVTNNDDSIVTILEQATTSTYSIEDENNRFHACIKIAKAYTIIGDYDDTVSILEQATTSARFMKMFRRDDAFLTIANAYMTIDKYNHAITILEEVSNNAEMIRYCPDKQLNDKQLKIDGLMANAYAMIGDRDKAINIAHSIKKRTARISTFLGIANIYLTIVAS